MLVFAIDDEPVVLETLHDAIAQALPGAQITDFGRGQDALNAIREKGILPDIVFSDIRMPDMDGLELAAAIKTASPDTRIIFVTAYSQYALEAWKRHVHGYLVKPVTAEDILEVVREIPMPAEPAQDKLQVRCFGHFEVYWRGEPVIFGRKQSKELLAYLIDREGAVCTAEKIAAALWEDETDMVSAQGRIRKIISDLKATLHGIGMDDVLIRRHRQLAIRRERVECDYYRMLSGDADAINAYRGEYMVDYSWAEITGGRLYFRSDQGKVL